MVKMMFFAKNQELKDEKSFATSRVRHYHLISMDFELLGHVPIFALLKMFTLLFLRALELTKYFTIQVRDL